MSRPRVLYEHPGARWSAVWFGPVFAALGALAVYLSGPVNVVLWLVVGVCLTAATALWVGARRAVCTVRLTEDVLSVGREHLAVGRIRSVDGVAAPVGARVLGEVWAVPKRFTPVPLRLDDDSVVVAWARDGERLRSALRSVSH